MKKIVTSCTRDCPGGCSIIAEVEKEKPVKLKGNPDHDKTQGYICPNMSNYIKDVQDNPNRIIYPLLKEKNGWKRINWENALNIVASKISELIENDESQSILYYQGFGSRTALKLLNNRFFNLLGGVSTLSGTICGGIGQAGQEMDFGRRISHDPVDHLRSKLIIIWGRNPAVTDIHLWKILREAQKNGTILVVIDPLKTKTAKKADIYIRPKAGTDKYLAIALSKVLISENKVDWKFIKEKTNNYEDYYRILKKFKIHELSNKCKVKPSEIKKLAKLYYECSPSTIVTGWGLHRYIDGHLTFRYIDALTALAGNIGISGGGISQGFDEFGFFNRKIQKNESGVNQRNISMPIVGEEILNSDPPIKLAIISSGNPVNLSPNSNKVKRAFKSVHFVIMIDHFLNDTSEVVDLFLPGTTFLEEVDLVGSYGHNWISPVNQVFDPKGEAKSELKIFQDLADKLGFGKEMEGTHNYWLQKIASPIVDMGISLDEILTEPVKMISKNDIPFADKKFKTKSGLFEFVTYFREELIKHTDYPYRLISTMPEKWIGSVIPESEKKLGIIEVNINSSTIEDHGLNDGDIVLLKSEVGELNVRVFKNDDIPKDIIQTYRGGWMMFEKNVNVLTKDTISSHGEGAPYHDTWVKIVN